jgi:hypothetical protein
MVAPIDTESPLPQTLLDTVPGPTLPGAAARNDVHAQAHDSQFFWMMQSPPAAFSPLHIFAAFSADAKGPTTAR